MIRPTVPSIDEDDLAETTRQLASEEGTARRVKAILSVHNLGQMADMPAIMKVAEENEDAASALRASLQNRPAGTSGVMLGTYMHPSKYDETV